MMKQSSGTMTLPSVSAVALWHGEVSGQISDGMWENSRPHDHYKFWCHLDVVLGEKPSFTRVSGYWPAKRSYALTRLYQLKWDDPRHGTGYVLRDRMIALGRLAKANPGLCNDHPALRCAEYMPATLEEFTRCKTENAWPADYIAKYMNDMTMEFAVNYYATEYTFKELRADIDQIKNAMRMA